MEAVQPSPLVRWMNWAFSMGKRARAGAQVVPKKHGYHKHFTVCNFGCHCVVNDATVGI